ncbi:MAG: alpha-rhamnosidase [Citrobacter freundii]|nr:MAG: alpha-rhamnosidase [Citrobacter freundii]
MRYALPSFFSCLLLAQTIFAQQGSTALQCEHLTRPMGVDTYQPRLAWQSANTRPGAKQTAYQLWLSTDSVSLANDKNIYWTSGKIASAKNLIIYSGKKLEPFTRYYWKVKTWDGNAQSTGSAPISWFETGMMSRSNWQGSWISDRGNIQTLPAPYFRKKISLPKKIKQARAYIAAAGLYELYINGEKTGDHRLDPVYTRFDRRNLYVTYDITPQLQSGENAVGIILGNGWYNHQSIAVWNFDRAPWRQRPAFCMDIRVTYEDGSTETISTDASWKNHTGPIIFNSIYTGEHYDSRLEIPRWSNADFDDSKWSNSSLRAAPSGNIVSQLMVPIKNVEPVNPVSMRQFNDTDYLFDIGRNIAGVVKIKLRGDSGTIVRIMHGERLYGKPAQPKDPSKMGHLDLSNIDVYHRPKDDKDPFQTDIVILNGRDEIEFMPKFNYKGFQYIEVLSSKPIRLQQNDLTAYFMHSDVNAAGKIQSSNPLLDKIWKATNNSYLSNLFGYPTDCPQREKNGWTGDGHFAIESGLYNFDGITVYEKWMADHRDEQQPNGVLPDIIPTGGWGYGDANGTDWTSTIAIIPWNLYLFYGDAKALADNYDHIKAYVNHIDQISPSGLTTFGRGDWVPVRSPSSLEFTSSIYFFVDAEILAKAALLFGKKEDHAHYTALAKKIKTALNNKYFNKEKLIYASGTQTELSMALYWKIAAESDRKGIAANLADRVISDSFHLDVGVLGAKAILNALSDNGQAEIAYKLAVQHTYPSWGWWIVNGATTLYENWDINAPRDISLNHMMFGEIGAWFYKGLGGIKPDESAPGFSNVLLQPNFVTGLENFEATHDSPFGKISSGWKTKGDQIIYEISIPANSSASVRLPADISKASLDGKPVDAEKIQNLTSGLHRFLVTKRSGK